MEAQPSNPQTMDEFLRYLEGHKDLYEPAPTKKRPPGTPSVTPADGSRKRCPRPIYPKVSAQEELSTPQGGVLIVGNMEDGKEGNVTEEERCVPNKEEDRSPGISTDGNYRISNMEKTLLDCEIINAARPDPSFVHTESQNPDLSPHPAEIVTSISDPSHHRDPTEDQASHCFLCGNFFTVREQFLAHLKSHIDKTYACSECDKSFSRRGAFLKHLKSHKTKKTHLCSKCGKCFASKKDLMLHRKSHKVEKSHYCSECGTCFTLQKDLMLHLENHWRNKNCLCSECGECFAVKKDLILHLKSHKINTTHACYDCGYCFLRKKDLMRHLKSHKMGRTYSCYDCEFCFLRKKDLRLRLESHKLEKTYTCSECGECFPIMEDLTLHLKSHAVEKTYSCSKCGECFPIMEDLMLHLKSHAVEKTYSCSKCGECFPIMEDLMLHLKSHTVEKTYSCSECGECFPIMEDLTLHLKSHAVEKTYSCSECGECFPILEDLMLHLKSHTVEKTYSCSECGESFPIMEDLMLHLKSHAVEKTYLCTECGDCFPIMEVLMLHLKSHTMEKTYLCSECGKIFNERVRLLVHERSHTKDGLCPCSECGTCFESRKQLLSDMKSHTDKRQYFGLECGSDFTKESYLLSHQRILTGTTFSCPDCCAEFKDECYLIHHQSAKSKCTTFSSYSMMHSPQPVPVTPQPESSQEGANEKCAEEEVSPEASTDPGYRAEPQENIKLEEGPVCIKLEESSLKINSEIGGRGAQETIKAEEEEDGCVNIKEEEIQMEISTGDASVMHQDLKTEGEAEEHIKSEEEMTTEVCPDPDYRAEPQKNIKLEEGPVWIKLEESSLKISSEINAGRGAQETIKAQEEEDECVKIKEEEAPMEISTGDSSVMHRVFKTQEEAEERIKSEEEMTPEVCPEEIAGSGAQETIKVEEEEDGRVKIKEKEIQMEIRTGDSSVMPRELKTDDEAEERYKTEEKMTPEVCPDEQNVRCDPEKCGPGCKMNGCHDVPTDSSEKNLHSELSSERSSPGQSDAVSHLVSGSEAQTLSLSQSGEHSTERQELLPKQHCHAAPYVCLECGESFNQKAKLIVHQIKQKTSKPYTCLRCKRQFSDQCSFVRHGKTYTENVHTCPLCSLTFSHVNYLLGHLKSHFYGRSYLKSVCM